MLAEKFGKYSDYASVVLRLALGSILFWHGQAKLMNFAGTAGFFGGMFPAPSLFAVIAVLIELVGGAFLILGVLTRLSALLVALEFAVILFLRILIWKNPLVAFQGGNSFELDLLIFAAAVALILAGSGKLGLERQVFRKELI